MKQTLPSVLNAFVSKISTIKKSSAMLVMLLLLVSGNVLGQATVLFSQNFDGAWTTASTLSPAWTTATGGTTPDANDVWQMNTYTTGWGTYSSSYAPVGVTGAITGSQSARFHSGDAQSGSYGEFISPVIDFSSSGSLTKSLLFSMINTTGTDVVNIYMSTDGGTSWGSSLGTFGVYTSWTTLSINLGTTSSNCPRSIYAKGS